jgi:hypothetical protein
MSPGRAGNGRRIAYRPGSSEELLGVDVMSMSPRACGIDRQIRVGQSHRAVGMSAAALPAERIFTRPFVTLCAAVHAAGVVHAAAGGAPLRKEGAMPATASSGWSSACSLAALFRGRSWGGDRRRRRFLRPGRRSSPCRASTSSRRACRCCWRCGCCTASGWLLPHGRVHDCRRSLADHTSSGGDGHLGHDVLRHDRAVSRPVDPMVPETARCSWPRRR